jgi:hypothetical protein
MRWARPSSAAYRVDGRRVSRKEVESIVYDTPEIVRQGRQYRRLTMTGFVLIPAGFGTFVFGALVSLGTHWPRGAFLPFALAHAGVVGTGVILNSAPRDPIEDAIVAFNRDPQRHGYCLDRPPDPRPPSATGAR